MSWAGLTTAGRSGKYPVGRKTPATKLAPKTIVALLDDVYRLLRWLQSNELLASLPARPMIALPVSLPKHLAPDQLLTIETYAHQQKQLDAPDWLMLALYYVLAHGGLRISEVLDLQWRDVHLSTQRLVIRQGKNRRDRIVYLTQTAIDVLALHMQTVPYTYDDLVFSFQQPPLSYQKAYSLLRIWGQQAGIPHICPLVCVILMRPPYLTMVSRLIACAC